MSDLTTCTVQMQSWLVLLSPKILEILFLILMSQSPKLKLKSKINAAKMEHIHLSFRKLCFSKAWNCTKNSPRNHSANCPNIETLLASEQQLTLYLYTCLWHVLGDHSNNLAVYIFTHYKLCIILSLLCSTAHKVPLRSTAMQQIGTVLHGKKITQNSVSSV